MTRRTTKAAEAKENDKKPTEEKKVETEEPKNDFTADTDGGWNNDVNVVEDKIIDVEKVKVGEEKPIENLKAPEPSKMRDEPPRRDYGARGNDDYQSKRPRLVDERRQYQGGDRRSYDDRREPRYEGRRDSRYDDRRESRYEDRRDSRYDDRRDSRYENRYDGRREGGRFDSRRDNDRYDGGRRMEDRGGERRFDDRERYSGRNDFRRNEGYGRDRDYNDGRQPSRPPRQYPENTDPSNVLGFFKLSRYATEDDLREFIKNEGGSDSDIERINLICDRETKESRGFAFVYFTSVEKATEMKNILEGKSFMEREIRIDYSAKRF